MSPGSQMYRYRGACSPALICTGTLVHVPSSLALSNFTNFCKICKLKLHWFNIKVTGHHTKDFVKKILLSSQKKGWIICFFFAGTTGAPVAPAWPPQVVRPADQPSPPSSCHQIKHEDWVRGAVKTTFIFLAAMSAKAYCPPT